MALRLGELVAIISADDSKFHKTLDKVHAKLETVGKAGQFAALAGAATQLAASLGPAAGGAFSLAAGLGASIAPAAGVAVALPAVAVAWKTSLGIMQLAVSDLGDALGAAVEGDAKKFDQALQKMPPAARSVAKELGGALSGLKSTVQEAFFRPVKDATAGLGRQLRGPLQSGMATAAAGLGRLTAKAAGVAREGRSIATLKNVFGSIALTADRASVGVAPLLRGLRDLVNVGLSKLPQVGTAVGGVATRIGEWLQKIVKTGQASRWFDHGLSVLKQLGSIAANVGRALGAVFSAAAHGAGNMLTPIQNATKSLADWTKSDQGRQKLLDFFARGRDQLNQFGRIVGNVGRALGGVFKQAGKGSGDLLDNLERLSDKLATWANSSQGQQQLGETFSMLRDVTHDLMVIAPGLIVILGQLAGFITGLPEPVRGVVSNFLAWSIVIGVLSSKFGPLIRGIGMTAGAIGKIGKSFSNEGGAGNRFVGRMKRVFGAIGRGAKGAARSVGRTAASIGRSAANGASAAGRLAASGARAAWTAAASAGRAAVAFGIAALRMALSAARAALAVIVSGAQMAGAMAANVARVIGGWILMGIQALLAAGRIALAWIISMGPIALVVAAAILAVILIIKYWDKIVAFFTKTLPHWLKVAFDWVVGIIKKGAKLGFFGPVGLIISHWDKIKDFFTKKLPDAVSKGIDKVIGWVRSLPGWIKNAVGNMGKMLVGAGKDLLVGLWNGIVSKAEWLARSIGKLIGNIIPGPVKRVLGIASPSKVFAGFGKNLAEGMALGMTSNAGLVSDAAGALAGAAAGPSGLRRPGGGRGASGTGGGATAVRLEFSGADQEFLRFMRKVIRVKKGGNVQLALGGA